MKQALLTAACGIIAGVVSSVVIGSRPAPSIETAHIAETTETIPAVPAITGGDLATSTPIATATVAPNAPRDAPAERGRDGHLRDRDEHFDRITQHDVEPRLRDWASTAEADFGRNFRANGDAHGFTLRHVDCRTTTCIATVEFPSYERARQEMHALLGMYDQNCAVHVYLEPSAGTGTYTTDVAFTECVRRPAN